VLLWTLVALPAVGGAVLAAGAAVLGGRLERVAFPSAVAVATAVLALAAIAVGRRPAVSAPFLDGLAVTLQVDALAAVVLVTVAVVTLLVMLAAAAEIEQSRARFFGLLLLFLSGVLLTVTASSLLPLLIGWELMGAMSYALIGFGWREARRVGSATTAFLTTRAADLGLYAAAGAALAGGTAIAAPGGALALGSLPSMAGWPLHLATAGIVVAALGKAAQLPFSFWLARAMDGPSAVSALLHSAAMVAMGGYLLLRVEPLLVASGWGPGVVAWMGVTTAVLLGLVAVAQTDLKLLLAASTASQLGFVVLAAGVGTIAGGAAHLIAHAFVKSTLFLAAGAWLHALGTKQLSGLRGAARRFPAVGALFVVAGLAIAGLPPLSLWATKDAVLAAAERTDPALYAAGLVAAALAAVYAARAVAIVLRPVPPARQRKDGAEQEPTGRVPLLAWAPLAPLAVAAALGGVVALPPLFGLLSGALDGEAEPVSVVGLVVSAMLAVAVVLLVMPRAESLPQTVPARVRSFLHDWLLLERLAHAVAVRPVLALAQALAVFDDRVLHRAVLAVPHAVLGTGTGSGPMRADDDDDALASSVRAAGPVRLGLAGLARVADERGIDAGVRAVASRTRALGALARRPQTGQLHTYLAQAAAVLALSAALLLLVR